MFRAYAKNKPAPSLTGLMEVKGVQRDRSALSHTPDGLQVLLIMVVVLGQETDRVVSAGVADQNRNSVTSSSHLTVAVMVYVC